MQQLAANEVVVDANTSRWTFDRGGSVPVRTVDTRNVQVQVTMQPLPTRSPAVPGLTFDFVPMVDELKAALNGETLGGVKLETLAVPSTLTSDISVQTVFSRVPAAVTAPQVVVDALGGPPWASRHQLSAWFSSEISLTNPGPSSQPFVIDTAVSGPADSPTWQASALLTPVTGIRVGLFDGGTSTAGDLESTTPIIEWTKPGRGIANNYVLRVLRVDIDASRNLTWKPEPGIFIVHDELLAFPGGVLEPDTYYVFLVQAESCGAGGPEAPLRRSEQATCAHALTRSLLFSTPAE